MTHLARGRAHPPADHLEQRRLAGPVRAEQGEDAARRERSGRHRGAPRSARRPPAPRRR